MPPAADWNRFRELQTDIKWGSKWEVSIITMRKCHGREVIKSLRTSMDGRHHENMTNRINYSGLKGFTETQPAITEPV